MHTLKCTLGVSLAKLLCNKAQLKSGGAFLLEIMNTNVWIIQ